jgi:hypothetical protein
LVYFPYTDREERAIMEQRRVERKKGARAGRRLVE